MRVVSQMVLGGLLLGLPPTPVNAQVKRLPAVALAPPPRAAARLASHPDASNRPFQQPGEAGLPSLLKPPGASSAAQSLQMPSEPADDLPPGARPGVFQKLIFKGAWMPSMDARGVGISDLQLETVFALPCPTRGSPLLIIPGFAAHSFDGPEGGGRFDLPPRVYDAYVQLRWLRPVTERLGFDLSFTPGYFSDFEQGSTDAIRFNGHAFAAWDYTPRLKLVLGVAYIDRNDVGVLPGGGLIWEPHDDAVWELIFPRPRIARRVRFFGPERPGVEHWLYLAGEFGGNLWSVERADGSLDQLNYRDFRVILGLERKEIGGLGSHLEIAYVLGRKFEYDNPVGRRTFEPTDTLMLRGGLRY